MPTVLASWTWLAEETQGDEGAAKLQRPVRPPGAVRLWASAAPAGAAARSAPRTHQATVPSPWHPPPWLLFCFLGCLRDGSVRRTKWGAPHSSAQVGSLG